MKRICNILIIITVISTLGIPAAAQKIEYESSDHSQIVHLKTALNHLTVIELREPVTQVATGSVSFKVEWRENKVFVQPTEADASTNLFIWTASERLNYELEPAGNVAGMDFAVDQIPLAQPKPAIAPQPPQPSPTEILLTGKAVRLESAKPSHKPVEVTIRDLYESNGRLLVRYAVRNRGSHVYDMSGPQVYELIGVHYPQSLYPLLDSQLGDQESARVTAKQETPVAVLESHLQTEHLSPGEESLGVVTVGLPSGTQPTILRFQFPNDEKQPISALLVR
jgi:hypothetical protein